MSIQSLTGTTMDDVAAALNQRVRCPVCGSCATWALVGQANPRENATLYRLRCKRCLEQVFAKVGRLDPAPPRGGRELEMEHQALLAMETLFPAGGVYGALTPVDYIHFGGYEALVTRLFAGDGLLYRARRAGKRELPQMFHMAGALLRKLHDSCPDETSFRPLDTESKLTHLSQVYGEQLFSAPSIFGAFIQLRGAAARMARTRVAWTWSHGDFKPENVLYDGHKIVVFDTNLNTRGAFVYDIASFLNHVRLGARIIEWGTLRHYRQIEAAFLSGYGGLDAPQMMALRWAQLYFMLCYYGRYARRGRMARIYAQWRIGGLIRGAVKELTKA